MYADLTHARPESKSPDADNIPDIEQTPDDIAIIFFRKIVAAHIDLNGAGLVLHIEESGFAHDTERHDAAGDGYIVSIPRGAVFAGLMQVIVERIDDVRCLVGDIPRIRIRINTCFTKRMQLFAAALLLIVQRFRHVLVRIPAAMSAGKACFFYEEVWWALLDLNQ